MKKKKGFSEKGFEEGKGGKRETLGKPYPREKKKNEGKQRGTRTTREYKKVNSPRQFIHTQSKTAKEKSQQGWKKSYL